MSLRLRPLNLSEANDFIAQHHRHHKPTCGMKYAIGLESMPGLLCGAVIVGRPVAAATDWHRVAEVTRLCTDGTPHACSKLYAAAARVAAAMGYERIQTFILAEEPGTSLRAAGWRYDGMTAGGDWNRTAPGRGGRRTDQPMGPKQRWVKDLEQN